MSRVTDKFRQGRGSVVVVGVGALGTAAALELAAAAIDRIRLVDADRVELSNLHRQMLHEVADIGRPKALVAGGKLGRGSSLRIDVRAERFSAENAEELLADMDVAIDATDDTATKFLLNDVCVRAGMPLVHAGVVGLRGQLLMIVPGEGPCLRCLFPESPQEDETATCRDAGVLGPVAATIGTLEAHAALDALRGRAVPRLLRFDARSLAMRTTFPRQSPVCRVCVPQPLVLWPSEHGPKDRAHGAGSTDGEKEIS